VRDGLALFISRSCRDCLRTFRVSVYIPFVLILPRFLLVEGLNLESSDLLRFTFSTRFQIRRFDLSVFLGEAWSYLDSFIFSYKAPLFEPIDLPQSQEKTPFPDLFTGLMKLDAEKNFGLLPHLPQILRRTAQHHGCLHLDSLW